MTVESSSPSSIPPSFNFITICRYSPSPMLSVVRSWVSASLAMKRCTILRKYGFMGGSATRVFFRLTKSAFSRAMDRTRSSCVLLYPSTSTTIKGLFSIFCFDRTMALVRCWRELIVSPCQPMMRLASGESISTRIICSSDMSTAIFVKERPRCFRSSSTVDWMTSCIGRMIPLFLAIHHHLLPHRKRRACDPVETHCRGETAGDEEDHDGEEVLHHRLGLQGIGEILFLLLFWRLFLLRLFFGV